MSFKYEEIEDRLLMLSLFGFSPGVLFSFSLTKPIAAFLYLMRGKQTPCLF
jgi:hypothetical protein